MAALGEPMTALMAQIGHRSANLTLTTYAKDMSSDDERARLRALVDGEVRGLSGVYTGDTADEPVTRTPAA